MNFSSYKGLTISEVEKQRQKYGYNEIEEKFQSDIVRFLKKLVGPIPLMIEVALILSFVAGKWEDFFIILVLLGVNVGVDFLQEQKAHKALNALKKTLAPTALVLRDGIFKMINARELVPGDIIKLVIGDIVPADAKILEGNYIYVDQSTITGESLPVEKNKNDELYSSSIIQKGIILAQIVKIGHNSSIGKNAQLVAQAEREEVSHFQKAIFGIGKFLIVLSAILIVVVFAVLITRGDSFLEAIRFVLVLAVASIPVALPAVLSVTMAIGVGALAKKKAIVSNFKAIEELAGVDELCVDKTGTLTKNEIIVAEPKSYGQFDIADLFTYALLMLDAQQQSVIEKAIYNYAKIHNFLGGEKDYKIDKFIPFDPTRKMTEVFTHKDNRKYNFIMGAPQVILQQIEQNYIAKKIIKDIQLLADDGFRALVVARKDDDNDKFLPVGIISLIDPPRDDSKEVIAEIKKKGINIRMLTGDNTAIARFIAQVLHIGSSVLTGSIFLKNKKDKNKNFNSIDEINVFAEVVPEDKYYIVDALQKEGHMVAMTGDGVNDAPALKKADIGIAVSGSSPAARSAADIVLLDNGLSVIKDAVNYARMIFTRMQSYATFRIAETIRIIFFISFSVIIFNYSPLSAVMIILLALLNDIPVMSIAYDNAAIHEKPIKWHLRETLIISTILGLAGLASSFILFYWLNITGYTIATIQTILFLKLDVAGHSTLYITRTGRKHFWQRPFPSLKFFLPAISSRIIGTIVAVYGVFMSAINWQIVAYIWLYSTVWFLFNDQIKVLSYKLIDYYNEKSK